MPSPQHVLVYVVIIQTSQQGEQRCSSSSVLPESSPLWWHWQCWGQGRAQAGPWWWPGWSLCEPGSQSPGTPPQAGSGSTQLSHQKAPNGPKAGDGERQYGGLMWVYITQSIFPDTKQRCVSKYAKCTAWTLQKKKEEKTQTIIWHLI